MKCDIYIATFFFTTWYCGEDKNFPLMSNMYKVDLRGATRHLQDGGAEKFSKRPSGQTMPRGLDQRSTTEIEEPKMLAGEAQMWNN